MTKLTVKDLIQTKGKKQLIELCCKNPTDAKIAEQVGVDMIIVASERPYSDYDTVRGKLNISISNFELKLFDFYSIRNAAKKTFMTVGIPYGHCSSEKEVIKAGMQILKLGADAVYCSMSPEFIKAMTKEKIPVIGHVGMVPATKSWTGGFKAVGKNSSEAIKVYDDTKRLEDAGVIGVEMELVPTKVAEYITNNSEIIIISMGSGKGCDAQYLFAEDIFASHPDHIPRHAKTYADINKEMSKIEKIKYDALVSFISDVNSQKFPEDKNLIFINDNEYSKFIESFK